MEAGLPLTPLRAYAHEVPHYYLQNFGSATSHPNTNEYAAFAQDTIRVTDRLALNLGVRWDLQTFTTAGLISQPAVSAVGQGAVLALQLRSPSGIRLLVWRQAAPGGARRIWHLLRAHSADLQLGDPDGKRHHRRAASFSITRIIMTARSFRGIPIRWSVARSMRQTARCRRDSRRA